MPIPRTTFSKKKKHPRRPHISRFRLWRYCLMVSFLLFTPQPSCGLRIFSSSVSPTYVAVGENVTLSCHFSLAPEDLGVLAVEWNIKPADISQEETRVIWYAAKRIFDDYDPLHARVRFLSPNPASGNASISISDLKMTDTNTYQCVVRTLPGIKSSSIHLDVMKRPTKPECYVEGVVELDRKVLLRCKGSQGSPPIRYRWSMNGTGKHLPYDSTSDSRKGDLILTITKEVVPGTLVCTAVNLVGTKSCLVALSVKPSAGVIISASAVGVTVFIVITVILISCNRRWRRKVEVLRNEVLQDQPPPRKRLSKKNHQAVPLRFAPYARQEVKIKTQGNQKEKEMESEKAYVELAPRRKILYKF